MSNLWLPDDAENPETTSVEEYLLQLARKKDPKELVIAHDISPFETLEYVAEGAANIIYRFLDDQTGSPLEGTLLRLRKDVAHIQSYGLLQKFSDAFIAPLFGTSQLLQPRLVRVPYNTISLLNADLRATDLCSMARAMLADSTHSHFPHELCPTLDRPDSRRGLYLAEDEPYGIIVKDMTSNIPAGIITIEFKPKWLYQTPDIYPLRRCRNCALAAKKANSLSPADRRYGRVPCPLDLLSSNPTHVKHAVVRILRQQTAPGVLTTVKEHDEKGEFTAAIVKFLMSDGTLHELARLQGSLDRAGVLSLRQDTVPNTDFLVATTLRDCTMFVKVQVGEVGSGVVPEVYEARLGDLDLKVPTRAKMRQWWTTEKELRDEGWYGGRADGAMYSNIDCGLYRS